MASTPFILYDFCPPAGKKEGLPIYFGVFPSKILSEKK